ncbi:hypothetical protein THAOC_12163 [Thalassiosira oceanica]|uniref:Uncharacterized protein n=1 Tax=Thalassiosira oceanica TaxID=159749 RepID=K0SPE2_THAOC|nr:hypothetical protein THAOC_12163 [Thalassiosira oceanica]|eukprot:EJK66869.1 hypothetical protein THAOC_12163 [Thalassiosira oceanica]
MDSNDDDYRDIGPENEDHQTSPACRGPGAVDNGISLEAGGYRSWMWYRTKSLQRRVSIGDHLHLLPARDIGAGLLSGTSAAPLSVGLPSEFEFADQTTPLPG